MNLSTIPSCSWNRAELLWNTMDRLMRDMSAFSCNIITLYWCKSKWLFIHIHYCILSLVSPLSFNMSNLSDQSLMKYIIIQIFIFQSCCNKYSLEMHDVSNLMWAELCCELWSEHIVTLDHNLPFKSNQGKHNMMEILTFPSETEWLWRWRHNPQSKEACSQQGTLSPFPALHLDQPYDQGSYDLKIRIVLPLWWMKPNWTMSLFASCLLLCSRARKNSSTKWNLFLFLLFFWSFINRDLLRPPGSDLEAEHHRGDTHCQGEHWPPGEQPHHVSLITNN